MNVRNRQLSRLKEKWVQRFYNPTILWMHSARNAPHRALLVSNISGKFELHARDFVTGFSKKLTNRSGGTLFGSISPDGRFIFFLNDRSGDEYGHFLRIPFSGGRPLDITPSLPNYYSYGVDINDKNDRIVFTASISNEHKIYLVPFDQNRKPQRPRLLYRSSHLLSEALISPDGLYTFVVESPKETTAPPHMLLIKNEDGDITRMRPKIRGTFLPLTFSKRSSPRLILGITNASGAYRPNFFDLDTKKCKTITNDRNFTGDIFVLGWIENEGKLILCNVWQARHRLFLFDIRTQKMRLIGPDNGSFDLFFNSTILLPDKSILIKWQRFGVPPRILKLAPPSYKKSEKVYAPTSIPTLKRILKSAWCTSSDGEKIQMWVVRPENCTKICPFIIDIHGGPHGIVSDEFLPEAHTWLDHGFGYCAVNYRGSIGFGKKFEKKIYGNPGYWEVEDIVAARNRLVEKGWANPNQIILFGWSWGGYVTLLALGKYPRLWRAGVAGMPIADCVLQYKDEPAFFKAIDRERFGGTPKKVPKRYARSSPITYADNIQAPVLIIHGKNDVRCPPRQIRKFERVLKKRKKLIQVHWFPSGHIGGFADTRIRVANIKVALQFATQVLKKIPSRAKLEGNG